MLRRLLCMFCFVTGFLGACRTSLIYGRNFLDYVCSLPESDRTPTCATAARLSLHRVGSFPLRDEKEQKFQQEDFMKYLLMTLAALALVTTMTASSHLSESCCPGPCCLIKSSCCSK